MLYLATKTAWKVSKYGDFSGPYFCVFGPEILRIFHSVSWSSICNVLVFPRIINWRLSGSDFTELYTNHWSMLNISFTKSVSMFFKFMPLEKTLLPLAKLNLTFCWKKHKALIKITKKYNVQCKPLLDNSWNIYPITETWVYFFFVCSFWTTW